MLTSSAKAKGRRLASWFKDGILNRFPQLRSEDFVVTSSGTGGEDISLSPAARECFPFQIEAKNYARIAIYEWYDQACQHGNWAPIVVVKANRRRPLVIIDAEQFLDLVRNQSENNNN